MIKWTREQRARALVTLSLLLLVTALLYKARKALLPFVLGTIFAYIMLPLINRLDSVVRTKLGGRRLVRSLSVLAVYVLAIVVVLDLLAFIIPPIGAQVELLTQRLPYFARNVYQAAPGTVQEWLNKYNEVVPEDIRLPLQRSVESMIQSLVAAMQAGAFKTIGVVFSTLSFVLGLLVVPLWMFYILRDQPEIDASFYRLIPPAYREDVRNIQTLIDAVLGAYLRAQLILCFSVGLMFTIGLLILGIDFALLLGTIAGILEIVPILGPILGAIPAVLVTLATSPSRLLWVILLAFAVQEIENLFLVPQVARGMVRLHPALVMLLLVIGSEVAGVWGVILSVPLTAVVRDVTRYLYLRLAEQPLSPQEAMARTIQAAGTAIHLSRHRGLSKQ